MAISQSPRKRFLRRRSTPHSQGSVSNKSIQILSASLDNNDKNNHLKTDSDSGDHFISEKKISVIDNNLDSENFDIKNAELHLVKSLDSNSSKRKKLFEVRNENVENVELVRTKSESSYHKESIIADEDLNMLLNYFNLERRTQEKDFIPNNNQTDQENVNPKEKRKHFIDKVVDESNCAPKKVSKVIEEEPLKEIINNGPEKINASEKLIKNDENLKIANTNNLKITQLRLRDRISYFFGFKKTENKKTVGPILTGTEKDNEEDSIDDSDKESNFSFKNSSLRHNKTKQAGNFANLPALFENNEEKLHKEAHLFKYIKFPSSKLVLLDNANRDSFITQSLIIKNNLNGVYCLGFPWVVWNDYLCEDCGSRPTTSATTTFINVNSSLKTKRKLHAEETIETKKDLDFFIQKQKKLVNHKKFHLHIFRTHIKPRRTEPRLNGSGTIIFQINDGLEFSFWKKILQIILEDKLFGPLTAQNQESICGISWKNKKLYSICSLWLYPNGQYSNEKVIKLCEDIKDLLPDDLKPFIDSARYVHNNTLEIDVLYNEC
ncbi:uncharacterized protein ASCRUDRAFT_71955 [Ascoidea rubescens DSM 1968]|uniref:Uncharacterized protein n=1 Tax=Ascoidea rubescens DSM 1968 TaxID=1344418 RepID=A0A1D2VC23_9ASCO|nr:hypothetical protein ASCRUDRAFT_71955 [Ascoidea rubescens DSM 1968]ODV59238.1 hypothetical protein ASCRUDRAFT_71955 [Ascoidea rubescens DSM 1968]